ncbi:leucyl aminopeptidase [Oecophyllibacter saccharovorans]|uniref:Probable cytosol aminopeptidase n=1 Tax=Oecophyllibacter saccharovorans TaxID=2558360 RepID=A0A506URB0_9PROT|nr:leucyl aminopeptidase [Oecophyllibacter saccharovorans]TPW35888.1 leucyl aminopeptidase [Oecophyllibacter saccharovorans]
MLQVSFDTLPSPLTGSDAAPLSIALLCDGKNYADTPVFKQLDTLAGGALTRLAALRGFEGTAGQVAGLATPAQGIAQIQLVGCAAEGEGNPASVPEGLAVEQAAGRAVGALTGSKLGDGSALLVVPQSLAVFAPEAALGARLAAYRFDRYRTQPSKETPLTRLTVALADEQDVAAARQRWPELDAVSQGVFLTRDLVSEPANVLTPENFRDRIEALRRQGLEVEVLDEKRMRELGFGALLGVAQGSAHRPYTVIMRHRGGGDEAPLAFVGKGVTFDTGGISIKPSAGMEEMKTDMGGAATVVGLMQALALRKAPVNAVGIVGLVENMPSGDAQRPGDIVTSLSGQTIEILNTDAEGRLVLADLLTYVNREYTPSLMIDLATLTGAIVVSLGSEYAGLFSSDDVLARQLEAAGLEKDEKLWRMPMGPAYNKLLDSDVADVKNIGTRAGGSIQAAEFLKRFTGDTPWAHLDIAGTAWLAKGLPTKPKGASGFGVQLLDTFVRTHEGQAEGGKSDRNNNTRKK